jgi:radical SAM protein with 4Fe4S-binding SPASM domain
MDSFEAQLAFLDRSGIVEARLLGGEPTLHPDFIQIVEMALARGKRIVVFTNGLMPPKTLDYLASIPAEMCNVLVNMSSLPTAGSITYRAKTNRLNVLKTLGQRAIPGFTIHDINTPLTLLPDIITETNCRRSIRLGLAHPSLGKKNRYLHPKQYRTAAIKIIELAEQASASSIKLEFDCGFVRCMFSDEEMETLHRCGSTPEWHCSPILDIDLNGNALHCFPLAEQYQEMIHTSSKAGNIRDTLSSRTEPFRTAGIYQECSTCPLKQQGSCSGGCLAATIQRFKYTPFKVEIDELPHPNQNSG